MLPPINFLNRNLDRPQRYWTKFNSKKRPVWYHQNNQIFPKDLDVSRQVKILKKTTTLLNLQNMFRQKLLSSSVDRFTKR